MTYYGGKELADAFRTVRKNTIQIAEEIPEDKYDFKASPETRTVAQTLAHLAIAPQFQLHVHTNKVNDMTAVNFGELFQKFSAAETQPRSKAELIAYLTEEGDKFTAFLETVDEPFLSERVSLPPGAQPPNKTRFEMLLGAKEHEMHHRGQLMLVQRMLGQVPHLTRQMQERMAARQAAAAAAGQPAAAGQTR
jgi:uncharacterized damage-inducible protein DinB